MRAVEWGQTEQPGRDGGRQPAAAREERARLAAPAWTPSTPRRLSIQQAAPAVGPAAHLRDACGHRSHHTSQERVAGSYAQTSAKKVALMRPALAHHAPAQTHTHRGGVGLPAGAAGHRGLHHASRCDRLLGRALPLLPIWPAGRDRLTPKHQQFALPGARGVPRTRQGLE